MPSHVDIKGNEEADVAAKEAVNLPTTLSMSIPHLDLKGKIRSFSKSLWQERWSSLVNNVEEYPPEHLSLDFILPSQP